MYTLTQALVLFSGARTRKEMKVFANIVITALVLLLTTIYAFPQEISSPAQDVSDTALNYDISNVNFVANPQE